MADVTWPRTVLPPRNISVVPVVKSFSAGRTLSGHEQVLVPDAGYWEITLDQIPVRTNAQVLQWRTIESGCKGRANTILVPAYSRKLGPVLNSADAIVATISGAVAQGAVSASIEVTAGDALMAGQDFSVGERLYRIKSVESSSGDIYAVKFWPPARDAIADGTAAEFDHPVCRCRLKDERGMDAELNLLLYAEPSVMFCEDFA